MPIKEAENNRKEKPLEYPCLLQDIDDDVWLAINEACYVLIKSEGRIDVANHTKPSISIYGPLKIYTGTILMENE